MQYSGADPRPISLRETLTSIVIVESLLETEPGGLIDPPTPEEAQRYRADLAAMIDTLPSYRADIEILRHRTVNRLQQEAYRRLSRAAGDRTLDRIATLLEETGEPVRLDHTTAYGETITISLTPTAPITGDALPCRADDLSGPDTLGLIRLLEKIRIAET